MVSSILWISLPISSYTSCFFSSGMRFRDRSWMAPEIPASGFFTSCAILAASSPTTANPRARASSSSVRFAALTSRMTAVEPIHSPRVS